MTVCRGSGMTTSPSSWGSVFCDRRESFLMRKKKGFIGTCAKISHFGTTPQPSPRGAYLKATKGLLFLLPCTYVNKKTDRNVCSTLKKLNEEILRYRSEWRCVAWWFFSTCAKYALQNNNPSCRPEGVVLGDWRNLSSFAFLFLNPINTKRGNVDKKIFLRKRK